MKIKLRMTPDRNMSSVQGFVHLMATSEKSLLNLVGSGGSVFDLLFWIGLLDSLFAITDIH